MHSIGRREFCLGLGAMSAATALRGFAEPPRAQHPNVVFVLCDDLGWGDLDSYNHLSAIPTPNANRLAKEGMRWTDMHSGDAVCTPSRYGILTGRYCWRGKLKHGVLNGYSPDLIEPGRMTVASMLKADGYYTAGVGKWHLGLGKPPRTNYGAPLDPGPTDLGFDYYFGIPASLNMVPFLYFENNHVVEQATTYTPGCKKDDRAPQIPEKVADQPGFPPPGCKTPLGTRLQAGAIAPHFVLDQVLPTITDKAVSIIDERAAKPNQPFFLYVALPSPHNPWVPLPKYWGTSHAGKYGDYVVETDAMLGKIMHALDRNNLTKDTLIIFTSDNGADWKLDMAARYAHRANGPWRGEKADIWEGGHRVPFLARWPGHISAGSVCNELGCLIDFMATVAAIDGISLPRNAAEDSFNLLPALLEQSKKPIRESIINHSDDGMFAICQGKWKLEEGLGSGGFSPPKRVEPGPGGPKGQLYDLATDPYEKNNLYQRRPDIVNRLTAVLEKYERQGYTRPM